MSYPSMPQLWRLSAGCCHSKLLLLPKDVDAILAKAFNPCYSILSDHTIVLAGAAVGCLFDVRKVGFCF